MLSIIDLRYTLVVLCMFLIASVLCPVLWYLWIHVGSANANFFFATTLTYALAQVIQTLWSLDKDQLPPSLPCRCSWYQM